MEDNELSLAEFDEAYFKYQYLIIALNLASLAYTIKLVSEKVYLPGSITFLVVAICCFCVSIYCGLKAIKASLDYSAGKYKLKCLDKGINPKTGELLSTSEGEKDSKKVKIRESQIVYYDRSNIHTSLQFLVFLLGCISVAVFSFFQVSAKYHKAAVNKNDTAYVVHLHRYPSQYEDKKVKNSVRDSIQKIKTK